MVSTCSNGSAKKWNRTFCNFIDGTVAVAFVFSQEMLVTIAWGSANRAVVSDV